MAREEKSTDPFDSLLNLENQYYTEGYNLGVADGSKAGRIEGRIFGLEKGFEKFSEMGRLNGRAAVWNARLPPETQSSKPEDADPESKVPPLGGSERLRKHVHRLCALTDPDTLSTENGEDAVSDFDDRLKDAKAKATLISKMVGESDDLETATQAGGSSTTGLRVKKNENAKKTGEMEDFSGLPVGATKKT